jgi:hypothetical protein
MDPLRKRIRTGALAEGVFARGRWPLTLVRRGAKVPDDGTQWWQELPEDATAEQLRDVGYEVVDVVPVRRNATVALMEALSALRYIEGQDVAGMEPHQRPQDVAASALSAIGALFPAPPTEGAEQ